jgi:ABC-type antimicrobial peptide transport system permease subunit
MKTRFILGIAAVMIIVASFFVVQQISNPRKIFEQLVVKPIPHSVGTIEESSFITMDSVLRVLHFQISKADLQILLDRQQFTPIDDNKEFQRWDQNSESEVKIQKEDYLSAWKQRIEHSTKQPVNFTKTWQIFVLKEGNGRKYFFFDTNSTEAVFVAEAH